MIKRSLKDCKDYVDAMNFYMDYIEENFDSNKCKKCGGTGLIPLMCCNGRDCGCHGLPYDFLLCCDECGVDFVEKVNGI